jgi:hypothetical protein
LEPAHLKFNKNQQVKLRFLNFSDTTGEGMQEATGLIKKYNIEKSFLDRYFVHNSYINLTMRFLRLSLWREGEMINPLKADLYRKELLLQEILNFYEKGELNLPQIEFCVTTECTLKCANCSNLIPFFRKDKHLVLSFEDYKKEFTLLIDSVNSIGQLIFVGAEAMKNPELPEMLDLGSKESKIKLVKVLTNGTLIPSDSLLEIWREYRNKLIVVISDYSKNIALQPLLKHKEIISLLKKNNIKYLLLPNKMWNKEEAPKYRNYTKEETVSLFNNCYLANFHSIINGKLHVCPRSSNAYELGYINLTPRDFIDLRKIDKKDLRSELINFYKKSYFESCKYCVRLQDRVLPAQQIAE